MEEMKKELLASVEWLEEKAARGPEQEFIEEEQAIANKKEISKKNEAEMLDVTAALKIKTSALEDENKQEFVLATSLAEDAEKELASMAEVDDLDIIQQIVLDTNLDVLTVGGGGPGHYYDYNPYHGWGKVYKHNEGGVTTGSAGYSLSAKKMYPYAHARGEGSGIADDNDVTTWVKLYFAFWPRQNGHVRAYVPYYTRGWYQIRSNDKWYNSKEAVVDLDMNVQLFQNYWGGDIKNDVFRIKDDNINRNGRIDRSGSLYSGGIPVGANKWVIAEVAVRARVETEGSGSLATLNFKSPDNIYIPYVRFDFS
jgi:hypothetical protein